jgi:hypothetical protein
VSGVLAADRLEFGAEFTDRSNRREEKRRNQLSEK